MVAQEDEQMTMVVIKPFCKFVVWRLAHDKNKLVHVHQKIPNKSSILLQCFAQRAQRFERQSLAVIAQP